jgi:class 3 adenylate cyclase
MESKAADYYEVETSERFARLIQSLSKLIQSKNRDEALTTTIREIENFINAYGTSVWLLDPDDENKIILAKTYTEDGRVKEKQSFYLKGFTDGDKFDGLTGYIFSTGKPLKIINITDEKELSDISKNLKWSDKYKGWSSGDKEKIRPFLGVPIFSLKDKKKVIGVLRIATTKDRNPFSELDLRLAEIFSRILSFKLLSAQRQDMELDLFISLFEHEGKEKGFPTEDMIMNKAVKKFTSLFPGSHCTILLNDGTGKFYFKVSSAEHLMKKIESKDLKNEFYLADNSKTGTIIKSGKSFLKVGSVAEPLSSGKTKETCEIVVPATSFIGAPIFDISSKKMIGVIRSAKHSVDTENDFDDNDRFLLDLFAREIGFFLSFLRNREKRDALGIMFGFIPNDQVDSVIKEFEIPKTPSEELTIMFVDIKGFANFCNGILHSDSQKIITFLNIYFDEMGKYVEKHGGVINSIKGDEFLAVFNGFIGCKNHNLQAVECAFEICLEFYKSFQQEFINKFTEKFGIKFNSNIFEKSKFPIGIKIGIKTTSNVIIGAIGPKGSRTITITGQDINLASRLITELADCDEFKNDNRLILCFDSTIAENEAKKHEIIVNVYFKDIRGGGELVEYRIYKLSKAEWPPAEAIC